MDAVLSSLIFCGYGLYNEEEKYFSFLDDVQKSSSNSWTDYSSHHAAVIAAFTAKLLHKYCKTSVDILKISVHLNI